MLNHSRMRLVRKEGNAQGDTRLTAVVCKDGRSRQQHGLDDTRSRKPTAALAAPAVADSAERGSKQKREKRCESLLVGLLENVRSALAWSKVARDGEACEGRSTIKSA